MTFISRLGNRRALLRVGARFLLILAVPAILRAQTPDVHVWIDAPKSLAAGSTTTVVVEMALGPGWHVNSHTPAEKYLIPTTLTLDTTAGALSAVRYPPHVEKRFAFSDTPLRVYEGTVRFEIDLSLPPGAAGEASVSGNLSYQACSEKQCFPPAKIPLQATIAVTKPAPPAPSQ
jgi:DsbC/DsbD-like thiol-disulfide interchange protein